jgi:DNA-binding CsgD family transcriptional regulator
MSLAGSDPQQNASSASEFAARCRIQDTTMGIAAAATLTEPHFDAIVSGFYDAATGGRSWHAALEPLHTVFGARAVVLHTTDIVDGRMLALESAGADLDRTVLEYATQWEQRDPRKHRILALGAAVIGKWLHCTDAFDERFAQRNPFFRHFLAGHDARYSSMLVIPIDERTVTGFALELRAGRTPLDDDERELARRFGHHMQQALLSYERVRRLAAQVMVGHQLLRSFAFPMWLLDLDRRVQYANEAACTLELETIDVGRRDSRLRLTDDQADQQLTVRLHGLAQADHGAHAHVRLGRRGALPEHSSWLHLSVLEPAAVMGLAFGSQRSVLATLFRPSHMSHLDPYALGQMFEMTPTEARVAALLGEGLDPQGVATRLNVKLTTVRTHIRSVLARMGQKRVVDAVRVLREGQMLWAVAGAA